MRIAIAILLTVFCLSANSQKHLAYPSLLKVLEAMQHSGADNKKASNQVQVNTSTTQHGLSAMPFISEDSTEENDAFSRKIFAALPLIFAFYQLSLFLKLDLNKATHLFENKFLSYFSNHKYILTGVFRI